MKDSIRDFTKNFIRFFIYIAVFAQIVSGTVYLVCNFSQLIVYPETEEMVHAARTLVFDEYIGFLYPLFVRICLIVQNMSGIGYFLPVHTVQVLTMFFGAYYMIRSMFEGKKAWIFASYIMSIPMCMQTALMVSPFAFKMVCAFLIAGSMIRIVKNPGKIWQWLVLLGSFSMAAFNVPDDLFVWGISVLVFALVICLKRTDKISLARKICLLIAVVMVLLGTFGTLSVVTKEGSRGRMQKTVSSVLFQRTIWPKLDEKFIFLPYDVRYNWARGDCPATNSSSELITVWMGPVIENRVGTERAHELFMEAAMMQLSYNKRELFEYVSKDFIGYLFMPYSLLGYMQGEDGSAFSTLYGRMSMANTKMTYNYFSIFYVSLFVLTFAAVMKLVAKRKVIVKGYGKKALAVTALLGYQALWYTIVNVQGVDYRYSLFQTAVLAMLVLANCFTWEKDCVKTEVIQKQQKAIKKKPIVLGTAVCAGMVISIFAIMSRETYKESDLMAGTKVVCLGDSIWGLVEDESGIGALVENMTGTTVENYAIPGSTAADFDDTVVDNSNEWSLCRIVKKMQAEDGEKSQEIQEIETALKEADYLILAYGLNDYFQGIDAKTEEKNDLYTYEGALLNAVEYVQKQYPDVKIVLIGQTYCQFYSYGVVESDSDTEDFGGGVGMDYVLTAEKVAKESHSLFINMYQEIPMNEWNGLRYLEDATHLNETGRKKYAKVVSEYLLKDFKERNAQ